MIEINGKIFEGVTVVPNNFRYDMILRPKGNLDLVLLRTCHREFSGEKISSGFLSSKEFKYSYAPIHGIEDVGTCPMRIDVYESGKGQHSWAFLDFESPELKVKGKLLCNGEIRDFNGVAVCQGKTGTIQRVQISEPIRFAPNSPLCDTPHRTQDGSWQFKLSRGECLYHFDTRDGRLGRLTAIGYEGVLVREGQ